MNWLILGAVAIDLLVGDPRSIPHPVVLMGSLIDWCEARVRDLAQNQRQLQIGGAVLVVVVVGVSCLATAGLIELAGKIHPYAGIAVHLWLLATTLAIKSLRQHAQAVAKPLSQGDLTMARRQLAMMVGRDTEQLDEREIARGAVETVAENTVDGIISPLFYAFIGGAPLAMAYKAVNTMDSMIGYRDERYLHLGRAAARLDDLVNYLPARCSGLFYLAWAPLTPGGYAGVMRALRQDAPRHPSPNSGIPEAAVAGALGVQLGGVNYYCGVPSLRATMGEEVQALNQRHIQQTLNLTYGVTAMAVVCGLFLRHWLAG